MNAAHMEHVLALLGEILVVAALLLGAFRVRAWFGLAPLYVAIGSVQFLQTALAASVYFEIAPGILVSPGSVVLFSGSVMAVLLVYLREGTTEARRLMAGIVGANFAVALLSYIFALHISHPGTVNYLDLPQALFTANPRILLAGTLVLAVDVLAVIIVFERLQSVRALSQEMRIMLTLGSVLAFDSIAFATLGFLGEPIFGALLLSGVIAKTAAGLFYGLLVSVYLRWFDTGTIQSGARESEVPDPFKSLSFRQRFETLSADRQRDGVTQVNTRASLDQLFDGLFAAAKRRDVPMSVLMFDADHFKVVNDTHGHAVGDKVLRTMALALSEGLRDDDVIGRYGGEEFLVVLPGTPLSTAIVIAERLRLAVSAATGALPELEGAAVTVTVGVAERDAADTSPSCVLKRADARLYDGKRFGRDRVQSTTTPHGAAEAGPA